MLCASMSVRSWPSVVLASVTVVACAWAYPASAQPATTLESPALVNASLSALLVSSQPFGRSMPPHVGAIAPLGADHAEAQGAARRPAALPLLYASFVVLQGLDAHSTLTAVRAGGTEANPAVKGLVAEPATFVGAKLAATAATLYLTERLWKKHRVAAVVLLVAVNAAYGVIVANNYASRAGRR
jgi:hypothetical protein